MVCFRENLLIYLQSKYFVEKLGLLSLTLILTSNNHYHCQKCQGISFALFLPEQLRRFQTFRNFLVVEIKYCEDPFAPNLIELKQRLKTEKINVEWVIKGKDSIGNNIQLSHEGEVNSGGCIPRREASRYISTALHRP